MGGNDTAAGQYANAAAHGVFQAVEFVGLASGPAQAVLPLVGLAADKVIRGRYNSDDAVECLLARTVERVPGELE
ncbi:MAG: hypothetical protein R6U98_30245 [Pirellulaceae bacterium]